MLVIIECYVHIRTSTLSPVRRKKEKKSVSVCSVSEQSSSNQDRVGPSSNHDRVGAGLGARPSCLDARTLRVHVSVLNRSAFGNLIFKIAVICEKYVYI